MYQTLIQPIELQPNLTSDNWRIIDCRFDLKDTEAGRRAYMESHIPGAIYAHLDDDLSGDILAGTTGRHPLPTVEEAQLLFSRWGLDESTQVVAYDDRGGGIASRLWWMLRWLGHERVAVLNGGWPAWIASGFPVSNESTSVAPRDFPVQLRDDRKTTTDIVDKIRKASDYVLVDSRTSERYRGEVEPIDPVAGHIPGAINLPFPENLQDGNFREPEALRARFESALGNRSPEKVIFYCGRP